MNIGFMGLGKLGLPCALAVESKGHAVMGHDIDPKVTEYLKDKKIPYREEGASKLLKNSNIQNVNIKELCEFSEIIFVAVQTPHEEKYEGITRLPDERVDFNYSLLTLALEQLSEEIKKLKENKIVIIISTVLPGTIRREIIPIIPENLNLCYNPFFIAMGTTIENFLNPEFVLLGHHSKYAENKAKELYKTLHNKKVVTMSIESAELTKVAYNTIITSKISIANTLMEICHKIPGANVDDVVSALKQADDRIISPKYMDGGMGDGGGCHPRDNIALSWLAKKLNLSHDIYNDLMKTREDQTEWLANLIIENLTDDLSPVVILGKAFKPETNITVGSPAILLKNLLDEKEIDTEIWDPHIDKQKEWTKKHLFFIATKHPEFKDFYFPAKSVVIDPFRFIPKKRGINVIRIGE